MFVFTVISSKRPDEPLTYTLSKLYFILLRLTVTCHNDINEKYAMLIAGFCWSFLWALSRVDYRRISPSFGAQFPWPSDSIIRSLSAKRWLRVGQMILSHSQLRRGCSERFNRCLSQNTSRWLDARYSSIFEFEPLATFSLQKYTSELTCMTWYETACFFRFTLPGGILAYSNENRIVDTDFVRERFFYRQE